MATKKTKAAADVSEQALEDATPVEEVSENEIQGNPSVQAAANPMELGNDRQGGFQIVDLNNFDFGSTPTWNTGILPGLYRKLLNAKNKMIILKNFKIDGYSFPCYPCYVYTNASPFLLINCPPSFSSTVQGNPAYWLYFEITNKDAISIQS